MIDRSLIDKTIELYCQKCHGKFPVVAWLGRLRLCSSCNEVNSADGGGLDFPLTSQKFMELASMPNEEDGMREFEEIKVSHIIQHDTKCAKYWASQGDFKLACKIMERVFSMKKEQTSKTEVGAKDEK